jgi:hypothetical protein
MLGHRYIGYVGALKYIYVRALLYRICWDIGISDMLGRWYIGYVGALICNVTYIYVRALL